MKIAVAVHGRFYAFDFARALIRRGHEVRVFTNYPALFVRKFGLPRSSIRTFPLHGVASRLFDRLLGRSHASRITGVLHRSFGRWAAHCISQENWDCIKLFSGVAEETLRCPRTSACRIVVRGSAHIRTQARLLKEEAARCRHPLEQPRPWMIRREEREYGLADYVLTLSSFAQNTFIEEGFEPDRVLKLGPGVDVRQFRASDQVIDERCRRIESGSPLRVLTVGTLSFRKGLYDYSQVVNALSTQGFVFRFVGGVTPEAESILADLDGRLEILQRQPEYRLPECYAWADLFLFPTIEDGAAVVLNQANASGLPILSTFHCSGPDLVKEGVNGWTLPIRSPEAFVEQLRECSLQRSALSGMVRNIHTGFESRDWNDVAADFEQMYERLGKRALAQVC